MAKKEPKIKREVIGNHIFYWTTIKFRDGTKIEHRSGFPLHNNSFAAREATYREFEKEIKLIIYEHRNKDKL